MATGGSSNTSTFFGGRPIRNGTTTSTTPSRSSRLNTRLSSASALELISSGEPQPQPRPELPHPRRHSRLSRVVADENLSYQPGMLLRDRPFVYDGDLESGVGEDDVYSFGEVGPSRNNSELSEIKHMVQEQQAMMRSILMNQEKIQERQALYEQKIEQLEGKMDQRSSALSSDTSPSTSKKRKVVVSRGISKMVSLAHSNMEQQLKFDESSASPHNAKVREAIVSQITSDPNSSVPIDVATSAVRRYYENERRKMKEHQDGMEVYVEDQSKKRKYRSRRYRTFEKRSSVVKEAELERWNQLSYYFMTEESDDEQEPNCIVLHKLEWRSETLNQYIAILEARLSKLVSTQESNVAKKVRVLGDLSKSKPPQGAPSWAIKKESASVQEREELRDITNIQPCTQTELL